MTDFISLGSSPVEEDCAQVGSIDYEDKWKDECRKYKKLLEYRFPQYEEFNTRFKIKAFPHDFGTYHEVAILFDNSNEDFAFFVENNIPNTWEDAEILIFKE